MLKLNFDEENSLWLTSSLTLRKVIGVLGMALPLLLVVFLAIDSGWSSPLYSISHYYYTRVSGVLVSVLAILGIFLIIYKGKEPVDFYISLLAGVSILCVVCFPTYNISDVCCDPQARYSVTVLKRSAFREGFHYASAGVFLLSLAYMSYFLFTKSNRDPASRGARKVARNRIYRVCGIIMVLAILIIGFGFLELIPSDWYDRNHLTFWMETVAVEAFGFSWLVKGEALLKDLPNS